MDLDNVVLVGHSRGGEGVARASLEIPLDAPYRVSGQVLARPDRLLAADLAYVPTVTVLPYCDGDVFDLMGQSYTDRSRDLTTDDTSMKSSVLVMGANHNFFNTEWTPGLSTALRRGRLPGAGTRAPARPASATRLTADGAARRRQGVRRRRGPAVRRGRGRLPADVRRRPPSGSASAGDAVVLSHMLGGGRAVRRPGIDATPADSATATVRLCAGATPWENIRQEPAAATRATTASPRTGRGVDEQSPVVQALQMRWTASRRRWAVSSCPSRSTSPGPPPWTSARSWTPGSATCDLEVRVTDATGHGPGARRRPGRRWSRSAASRRRRGGRYWAQTLQGRPRRAGRRGPRARSARIELVGLSEAGRVWLLDVSAVPTGTGRRCRSKRMPLVDLGAVKVKRGARGHPASPRCRSTCVGDLASPTPSCGSTRQDPPVRTSAPPAPSPSVGRLGGDPRRQRRRHASRWEYAGDELDSVTPTGHRDAGARRSSEVLARDYHGQLAIVDDDPSPRHAVQVDGRRGDGGRHHDLGGQAQGAVEASGCWSGCRPVAGDGSPVHGERRARSAG